VIGALYAALAPILRALDPETAHALTIRALRLAPPRPAPADDPILATSVWGRRFPNPIGLAAGFDKQAEALAPLAALGFGFVEAGGVTPRPQPGNPRPRAFRLPADRAVINRYGFNSVGLDTFARRLAAFRAAGPSVASAAAPVGVNLGKNKDSADAAADYAAGARRLAPLADFLVVNVSSPNTPGLRALQGRAELAAIAAAARGAMRTAMQGAGAAPPPLLVKVAPDLAEADIADVAALALEGAFDGVIVSNTTVVRPSSLVGRHRGEAGGLSGAPLKPLALAALRAMRRLTSGRVPLVGCGGIASGADAYERIRAGAALVQLYTALVYSGPGLVGRIKRDLAALLRRDGFANVAAAVGAPSAID
jgi:dihydroorotate dehydrogenase